MTVRDFGDLTFGAGTFGGALSIATASGITYAVEVDLTTPLLGVPASWVAVTDYVRNFSTRRGRSHELGKMQAGEASLTLDNRDRRFDPTNTAGPYYPNLLPMRHARIRATTASSFTYDLFTGFVEDWGQQWSGPAAATMGDATCEVQLVDAFSVLNRIDLTTYPTEVLADAPFIYLPFDDPSPILPYANQGGGSAFGLEAPNGVPTWGGVGPLYGGAGAFNVTTGNAGGFNLAKSFVDTDTARGHLKGDWTVEAWVKRGANGTGSRWVIPIQVLSNQDWWAGFRLGATTVGNQWKVEVLIGDTTVAPQRSTNALAAGWHHVAVVRRSSTADLYVDGAFVETITSLGAGNDNSDAVDTSIQVSPNDDGAAVAQVAVYDYALGANRIAAHHAATLGVIAAGQSVDTVIGTVLDVIGWPAGLRSLAASGHTVARHLADPNALTELLMLAEDTDGGVVFATGAGVLRFRSADDLRKDTVTAASWGDSSSELKYSGLVLRYDDADLYTEVRATSDGLADAVATDTAAAVTYGPRSLETPGGVLADQSQLNDRAAGYLARYKAPQIRPETLLAVDSVSQPTRTEEMFASEIGRRVAVTRRPPGGGAPLALTALVEGVSHSPVEALAQCRTTLNLVPVADATPWILGDAINGVLDSTTDLGW